MKKLFKFFSVVLILPLILYEGYYQTLEYKKRNNKNKNQTSTTTIRHIDRGYYWNYPFHQEFINYNEDGEQILIHTDALGFRNPNVDKEYDILLLGDSYTAAANTREDLSFSSYFKKAGLSLYNAGIEGTGTIHQAHILNDVLAHLTPKVVVLNFYLGNDFRDNFYCVDIEDTQLKPLLSQEEPNAIQTPHQTKWSWIQLKATLNNAMHYSGVLKLFYNTVYLPKKYADTDISYYNRGELLVMAYKEDKKNPDVTKAIEKTDRALNYIRARLEQKNIKLLVVGIPSKAQVIRSVREISNFDQDKKANEFFATVKEDLDFDAPDKILEALCKKHHISYISLLKPFRQQSNKKLYYHFDSHWTFQGQEAAANTILPEVKKMLGKAN